MLRLTVEPINRVERGCLLQPERAGEPRPSFSFASSGVFSVLAEAEILDAFGLEFAEYQVQSDFPILIEPARMLRSDLGTVLRGPSADGQGSNGTRHNGSGHFNQPSPSHHP